MKRISFLLCLTLLSFLSKAQELAGQTIYNTDFTIDNRPRECLFYIPKDYNKEEKTYPLLVVLHDSGSNSKNVIKDYGDFLHATADSLQAVILYPNAFKNSWGIANAKDSVNDVGFLSIVVEYFVQRYSFNADKVFVAGFGQGGLMANKIGCDLPERITAIANLSAKPNSYTCKVPALQQSAISFDAKGKVLNTTFQNMWKFFMP